MKQVLKRFTLLCLAAGNVWAAPVGPALDRPAIPSQLAARSVLQAAAKAGNNIVAVGERGTVVLSSDGGRTWRQAPVPVSVGLTAIRFIDAKLGWAVGHGGVVLATRDGGETWAKQLDGIRIAQLVRKDAADSGDARALAEAERLVAQGADKPLLDLHFFDARRGIVVGAYNLALLTEDGGKSWRSISRRLDNPKTLHLNALRVRGTQIVLAGEQGLVMRSVDGGATFKRLETPYRGSFFVAEVPSDDDIVVAGLRGNAWRSADGGRSWTQLASPVPASFTGSGVDSQGRIWLGNQAGNLFTVEGNTLIPGANSLPPLNGILPLDKDRGIGLSDIGVLAISLQGTPR